MIEMIKTRKQQLEERIKRLESYVYEDNDTPELKKIYEDHIKFLREELKQCEQFDYIVKRVEVLK